MAWGALIAGATSGRVIQAKPVALGTSNRPINISFARIACSRHTKGPSHIVKSSSFNDFKYSIEEAGGDGGSTGGNGGDNDDWGDSADDDDGNSFGGNIWVLLIAAVAAVGLFGAYQKRKQDKTKTHKQGGTTSGDLDLDT